MILIWFGGASEETIVEGGFVAKLIWISHCVEGIKLDVLKNVFHHFVILEEIKK